MARTYRNTSHGKYIRYPRYVGNIRESIRAREQLSEFGVTKNRINATLRNTVTEREDQKIAGRCETRQRYYHEQDS